MPQQQMKFTRIEGMSLLCVAFIFQSFNEIVTITVRETGTAAWISQLLGGLLAMGVLLLYLALFQRYEGQPLMQITRSVYGSVLGTAVNVALLAFYLFLCAVTLHEIIMLLRSFAYAEVPPLFLCIAIMATVCIVCRHPVKGLAMTNSLFFPFFLLLVAVVVALSSPQFNFHYLTPVLGYGPRQIGINGFYLISNFETLLFIPVFLPYFSGTKHYGKSAMTAIVIATLCFLVITLAYSLMFPYTATFQNSSAVLNMTQSVYINRFLQRFESAFVAGVTSSVILVLCVKTMAAKQVYCDLFGIRSEHQNTVLYPIVAAVVILTELLAALNAHESSYRNVAHKISSFVVVGFVLVTLGVSLLRKGGKRRRLRTAAALLACCLTASLLSGCGGYHEPDEEIYPVIMGYDRGESEKYKITFRLMLGKEAEGTPDVNNTISVDENGDPPPEIFVVEAPSALMALDAIGSLVPKRYSLMHINMLIVSEELARENLKDIVFPIIRHKETKNTMAFLVTRGSAQETIMAPTGKLDSSLPMFIESILEGKNGISNYDTVTIKDVYNSLEQGYGDPLAMYAGYQGLEDNGLDADDLESDGFLINHSTESGTPEDPTAYALDLERPGEESASESSSDSSSSGQPLPKNEESTTGITQESLDGPQESGEDEGGESSGDEDAAKENEMIGPKGEDMRVPDSRQPAADRIVDDLSKSLPQGYIPGQVPVKSSAKLELAGMAVIRDQKMVGSINSRENAVHMMLKGNLYNCYYDVLDPVNPEAQVVFRMSSRQATKAKARIDEHGVAHIELQLFLKGRVTVSQNEQVRYSDPEPRRMLEQYTARIIEEEANDLIDMLQHEYAADTLHLGDHIAGRFLTIPAWEEYDWHSKYPQANISVKVHLKL